MPGHDKASERCRVTIRFSKADTIQPEYDITVSRELITKHSEYFRAAFEHDCFIEAQTGVVVLDESDRLPCISFVDWIYREAGFRNMGELDPDSQNASEDSQPSDSSRSIINRPHRILDGFMRSLIFAEMRQAPGFHNWIMGKLIDGVESKKFHGFGIGTRMVEHVYSNSIKGSLSRKILVDIFVSQLHGRYSCVYRRLLVEGDHLYQPYHATFLEDVLLASLNPTQASLSPTVWNRAPYMVEVGGVRRA
ncbi:hypothetical protein MBLNU457_g2952t1 [Dothideomycetes sp. NU457]